MKAPIIPLSDLLPDEYAVIYYLNLDGIMRRRLLDLGFVKGTPVVCIQRSPLGDPVAYQIRNTMIALRKSESSKILVHRDKGG